MDTFNAFLWGTWALVAEVAPWLLVGFALAGLISILLKRSYVERLLGRPGIGSLFKATLVGVPMPLCSCGVIPVAAAIREHGASKGATAAFLASTPQTGVDSIAATWGLLGPFLAWVRVVIAFVSGILAGLFVSWVTREDEPGKPAKATEQPCCCGDKTKPATTPAPATAEAEACCAHSGEPSDHCCADEEHHHSQAGHHDHEATEASCHAEPAATAEPGLGKKLGQALRYGFVTLPQDMVLSLTLGLVLAGAIGALLPAGMFADLGLTGFWAYAAITALSVPLYVCSTGSIPFAYVLLQAGLSPGGVLVFLVAGPATNAATLTTMRRYIGIRGLAAYLAAIVGTAWVAGALVDAGLGKQAVLQHIHEHALTPSAFQHVAGIALILMLAHAAWQRWR